MHPSVGRIVHYVSHGSPIREDGTQQYASECRAAIVTAVAPSGPVSLAVLNPSGLFFDQAVYQQGAFDPDMDDPSNRRGGTWHWPERTN